MNTSRISHVVARELASQLLGDQHADVVLAARRMTERWKSDHALNTIFQKTYALRQILRHIDSQEHTATEREVKPPARMQARLRLATDSEVSKMLRHAPAHLAIAIRLMRQLALRWSEALRASPAGLDLKRKSLTVMVKGGQLTRTAIDPAMLRILAPIGEPQDTRSFVEILHGSPIAKPSMRQAWERCRKKSGIDITLHPHDLRRTAAVELYERTHDIFAVQRMLGHTSIATTAWYLRAYEPQKENEK